MRGHIFYRERSLQVKDYSTLRYKNITPTDIDGYFEIKNKVFVFIELKGVNAPFLDGQKLALERLVDSLNKPAILVIGEHNTPVDEDIDVAKCKVWKYRYRRYWHDDGRTVKEVIDAFLKYHKLKEYV